MIYVMSDIHGCNGRYRNILKQIKLKADDHLYILGDVIDRGPRGLSILRETMQKENITLLMGNHEHMMLEVLTDPDDADALWLWYRNGGKVTHEHFKHCTHAYRAEVVDYIRNLPINIEVSVNGTDYVLVHGAPLCTFSESSRSRTAREHAIWTRLGRSTPMMEGKMVVFGHTPTHHYLPDFPMRIWHGRDKIGIDCGCAWGADGKLGCLRLDDMAEFYSEEEV